MNARILVVDDEPSILLTLSEALRDNGYTVEEAADVSSAVSMMKAAEYDIVVTDKNMLSTDGGDEGGMEVLAYAKKNSLGTEVIMVTGYASVDTVLTAMKLGAFDYLVKPFKHQQLLGKIERILEYKSFINPTNAIGIYRSIHDEILELIENRKSIEDEELHSCLKAINARIDAFFRTQREWERIILLQRDALSRIAALATDASEGAEGESAEVLQRIMQEAERRL